MENRVRHAVRKVGFSLLDEIRPAARRMHAAQKIVSDQRIVAEGLEDAVHKASVSKIPQPSKPLQIIIVIAAAAAVVVVVVEFQFHVLRCRVEYRRVRKA